MNTKSEQATILLVEEDDDTRPIIRSNLQRDGYRVLLALDEEDAMQRVSDASAHADLIIISLIGKTPEESLESGRRITRQGNYDGSTPLIIIVDKYGADVAGTDVKVSENVWISYPEDSDQLHNLVARLLNETSSAEASRTSSQQLGNYESE